MEQKAITENEKKKEYLMRYQKYVRQMERSEQKIQQMRLSKVCPSMIADGMPHASSNACDLSGYVAILDQEEQRYIKARYLRIKKCREITDKIERLQSEDEKDVLFNRYIGLMKWEDICVKMEYSWKQIHRIHSRALNNFKMT